MHWRAMHLLRFEIAIEHIQRTNNIGAYALSCWNKEYQKNAAQRSETVAALYKDTVPSAEGLKQGTVERLRKNEKYKTLCRIFNMMVRKYLGKMIAYGSRRNPSKPNYQLCRKLSVKNVGIEHTQQCSNLHI